VAAVVVQQTLRYAYQAPDRFEYRTEAEPAAWLRTIPAHPMANAVRDMTDAQRGAIAPHDVGGCAVDEAAAQRGKSHSVVVGLLHRGLKQLRERLRGMEIHLHRARLFRDRAALAEARVLI
jgi:DNA-directed RNA polymerase specialized sigma24 family protein